MLMLPRQPVKRAHAPLGPFSAHHLQIPLSLPAVEYDVYLQTIVNRIGSGYDSLSLHSASAMYWTFHVARPQP